MEKQTIYLALLFALIAAVGNALFAFGQKKSVVADQPFIFIISALVVCLALFAITFFFLPKPEISTFIKDNYPWVLISGLGFWLIFIGFYFLYSRYGASHYVVYAVLSIVSTSISGNHSFQRGVQPLSLPVRHYSHFDGSAVYYRPSQE